ncbi:unnamed protein product [Clonostachys rosea f. rosea IK726]|uniref:Uncharacterized protein n=1 Tax=Clonostachys rosea f. rosea IK726 TaxID=1349383 RepID=A0ACA9UFR9_BIOOC|nr:unnamed protein product [Clonostachys rosea f. rosea IK726]
MAVSISRVLFEHHYPTAQGIGESEPRVSWRFAGNSPSWEQKGYDLEITRDSDGVPRLYNVNSSDSVYVPWPDEPLGSAELASVRVRAYGGSDDSSSPTEWSEVVTVETGLLDEDWGGAVSIAAEYTQPSDAPLRPLYFRKSFQLESEVKSARLYITAHGLYKAEINGAAVGDIVLAPGIQSYWNRLVYDTYDVTDKLKSGENVIGALVGEGWYSGRYGFSATRHHWGDQQGLLSLLVIQLKDGSEVKIPSDTSWEAIDGPVITSEIYDGEVYDARLEKGIVGWSSPGFETNQTFPTYKFEPRHGKLTPLDSSPLHRIQEVKPVSVFNSPAGKTLVDFGQNLVGWLRLKVQGPAGSLITIRHAEVLDEGEIGIRPLRTALARLNITLGEDELDFEPSFTYFGFRYIQVEGWPEGYPLNETSVKAIVIHSDMERTGWLETSHEMLNQFHQNTVWSMKGNFFSIPTDCPQRDERLGWTGDATVFAPAANFLHDTAGFWRGWHRDVWSEMQNLGPEDRDIAAFFIPYLPPTEAPTAAAVWGDVAVSGPFELWQTTGDPVILEEQFVQSQAWLSTGIPRNDRGLWALDSFGFGDWLDPTAPPESPGQALTHNILVADSYLIRMTEMVANMSQALGKDDLAQQYREERQKLIGEYQKFWMNDGGELANRSQTAYSLALNFEIYTDEEKKAAASQTLRDIIEENNYLVGTGFAGTPALGFALRKIGAVEDMYAMLLQTEVPSWLYQVKMGATTTWERWDSMLADGTINPGEMTSFNHYAFGGVANWMHQVIGGLAPQEPGWKKILVAPVPGGGLTRANCTYLSPYGLINSQWRIEDGFHLNVEVPPNSKAHVVLPNGDEFDVLSGSHEFHDLNYKTT